jgi:hypothetical protein
LTTLSIRHELSENLPSPVDRERFENLAFRLGVAADKGEMPSFSDQGARSGYALDFFCRARNLAGLFILEQDDPSFPAGWSDAMLNTPNATFNLTSLGGGPGFDFVAAALASTFYAAGNGEAPSIHATILDYEEGWSNLVQAMDAATRNVLQQPQMSCCWGGKCDITKPIAHTDNAACLAEISSTQLWTCQYCIAENRHLLRASNYVFFQDLFEAAPEGAMFLFTETTPRIWPDFCNLVAEHCGYMEVGFPSKKGRQMVLRKQSSENKNRRFLSDKDVELLKDFENISELHERKLQAGWERQEQKIRGSTSANPPGALPGV